jgi:CheY-like chemotaxis protein
VNISQCSIPQSATPSRRTILVVDDSPETLAPLGRLLELIGYDVRLASSAAEAIRQAAAAPVDLIISDVGLPDRNGVDLMREVRAVHGLPGIAVTGHATDDVIRDCRSAGFDRHFSKPVLFDDLRAAISELLH